MPTPRLSIRISRYRSCARSRPAAASRRLLASTVCIPNSIYRWKRQLHKYGERSFGGRGNAYTEEARIAQLERTLGQMAAENALFGKKAIATLQQLQRSNGARRSSR